MAKIESVIKLEIIRLARRALRSTFLPIKREVRQMRVKLSGLSRGIASLNRTAKELRLEEAKPKLEATPEEVKASRLTAERIRGLRKKLGISQREMGIITGASLTAVVSWESGKFKPRGDKKAALVALRKLKKRDVKKMLSEKTRVAKESKPRRKPATKARSRKKVTRRRKLTVKQSKSVAKKARK